MHGGKMTNNEIYLGTKDKFKKYFGPYLRNLVNYFTKSGKNQSGSVCEFCRRETTLEAAHMRGMERTKIIDEVLDENFKNKDNDYYTVNIQAFEKFFMEKHLPIHKHFHFLCRDCHRAYDNNEIDLPELAADEIALPVRDEIVTSVRKQKLPAFPQGLPREFERGSDETIQNYVKRLLPQLKAMGLLTETILQQLQDANYSKITFGLPYPLLEENYGKIFRSGGNRYWKEYRFGKYYVCNHWQVSSGSDSYVFTRKIYAWLEKIFAVRAK